MVNASTPAGYVELVAPMMDVGALDLVVESGNVSSLTPFLTLNASDGVCFAANGGSSDLFLFGTGNHADMTGYGGLPDGLIRCGGGISGTPCAGNLALKSGHVNVSGDHIVLAKENLNSDASIGNFARSDDIYLKSNHVIIDADILHVGNISNDQQSFTENTQVANNNSTNKRNSILVKVTTANKTSGRTDPLFRGESDAYGIDVTSFFAQIWLPF